jgi:regulator of protease activity HflC (stomatin/prohibitin superfamily)
MFILGALGSFFACLIGVPILLGLARFFGLYAIVEERSCLVFTLFGKVEACISEPGLHSPFLTELGLSAFLVPFFGAVYTVDLRTDQEYLRSQPVNSEEGAPMGIGIWYEMYVSDPVSFLFKNTDPRGSLRANVSSATVRCLSNLQLESMLENRHTMSRAVRTEVSEKSQEWGYKLGSVYIRKVHFRDAAMIRGIEEKVVNRLRQVTAAIVQNGMNQVRVIGSNAERTAAIEFAKAAAMRPAIVGAALQEISKDAEVASAMFQVLETQRMVEGDVDVTLVPQGPNGELLNSLLAAGAQYPAGRSASAPTSGGAPPPAIPGTGHPPSFDQPWPNAPSA